MNTNNSIQRKRIPQVAQERISNRFVWREVQGPQRPTFSYTVFDPVFGAFQGGSGRSHDMTVVTQFSRCYTRYSGIFRCANRFSSSQRVPTTRGG